MPSSATKTIEIRRHAERHKPGHNLNARGVARARNASAGDREFALVIASPLPRAVQTAVAMGHAVDEEDWTMATIGVALDDFPWDISFAAMQQEIRTNPVASAWATRLTAQLRHWLARIDPGEELFVVNHGGTAEVCVIGLLGDADAAAFESSLDYCEGVRLDLDGVRVVGAQLLRFEGNREVEIAPGDRSLPGGQETLS